MTPDFQKAAIKAAEILVNSDVYKMPISAFHILKSLDNVQIVPFAEIASSMNMNRDELIDTFGSESRAAVTSMRMVNGKKYWLVAYSQYMPTILVQRALARELGHIVLEHDGSRPVEVRMAEAYCFAHHLLTPRAVIKMLQESEYPLTVEMLSNVTGCNLQCAERMRKLPAVNVPADLNKKIRDKFSTGLKDLFRYQDILLPSGNTDIINLGTFMDGYIE